MVQSALEAQRLVQINVIMMKTFIHQLGGLMTIGNKLY